MRSRAGLRYAAPTRPPPPDAPMVAAPCSATTGRCDPRGPVSPGIGQLSQQDNQAAFDCQIDCASETTPLPERFPAVSGFVRRARIFPRKSARDSDVLAAPFV